MKKSIIALSLFGLTGCLLPCEDGKHYPNCGHDLNNYETTTKPEVEKPKPEIEAPQSIHDRLAAIPEEDIITSQQCMDAALKEGSKEEVEKLPTFYAYCNIPRGGNKIEFTMCDTNDACYYDLVDSYESGLNIKTGIAVYNKPVVLSWFKEDEVKPETGNKPYQEVYDWLENRGVKGEHIDAVCTADEYKCSMEEYPSETYQGLQPTITYKNTDKYSAVVEIKYYPKQNGRFYLQQMHNVAPNKHQVINNDMHSASMNAFNGAFNSDTVYLKFIKMYKPDASGYKITTDSMGLINEVPLEYDHDIVFKQTLKVKNSEHHIVDHNTEYVFDVRKNDINKKFISIARMLKDGVQL